MADADPTAERRAARRIEATLDAARRVDLSRLIVGAPSPDVIDARRKARDAATEAGRIELLDAARQAATDWVLRAFAERAYSGTWAATEMAVSVTRPADRAAVAEALGDAVTASAVEDLVDADTLEALSSRWDMLNDSSSMPEPGALNDLTRSMVQAGERRGGMTAMLLGIVLLVLGAYGFGSPIGIGFLVVGLVVIGAALHGRRDS